MIGMSGRFYPFNEKCSRRFRTDRPIGVKIYEEKRIADFGCLKERTMEKNIKIELQLSEEELQAITGGCSQCTTDIAAAQNHQWNSTAFSSMSDHARIQANNTDLTAAERERYSALAVQHINTSLEHADQAISILQRVVQRVVARGHV